MGHMTVAVETNKMANVRERLRKLGIKPREDVSLANGARSGSKLDQVCLYLISNSHLSKLFTL